MRRRRAWYEQFVAMADARWNTDRSRTCMSTAGALAVSQCTAESRVERILTEVYKACFRDADSVIVAPL